MTQEDKELLLKDLCSRLPYEVKVHCEWNYYKGERAKKDGVLTEIDFSGNTILFQRSNDQITRIPFNRIDGTVKPYLRPLSSMTEEEKTTYKNHIFGITTGIDAANFMIWVYKHHLDIFHFIEKGIAIEAPKDMYTNN